MGPVKNDHARRWMWWFLAALVALQLYFVRELIAAFLLFTLGFALIGGILLAIVFVKQAGEASLAWAEPRTRGLTQAARRGMEYIEEFSRKPFRRPRSEPAP